MLKNKLNQKYLADLQYRENEDRAILLVNAIQNTECPKKKEEVQENKEAKDEEYPDKNFKGIISLTY